MRNAELQARLAEAQQTLDAIRSGQIDESWLTYVEGKDNIFPEIDYRVYRPA